MEIEALSINTEDRIFVWRMACVGRKDYNKWITVYREWKRVWRILCGVES